MSTVELLAALSGLACVILTVRQHVLCWPIGIASVALYIFVFFEAKLYSDMGLQVVYIFMQIYGWWYWLNGGDNQDGRREARVRRISRTAALTTALACSSGAYALGFMMHTQTDAALPYVDAVATVLSLAAQWLMGLKILESWLIWITVDVISIGMYGVKGLYLTSGLYLVFLVLACLGFISWLKSYRSVEADAGTGSDGLQREDLQYA